MLLCQGGYDCRMVCPLQKSILFSLLLKLIRMLYFGPSQAWIVMLDLMVPLPGGEIRMRDDRLKKEWNVQLKPFLMAKYPVTQDIYSEVVCANPSTFRGNRNPVETVSWREAIIFCNELSLQEGFSAY